MALLNKEQYAAVLTLLGENRKVEAVKFVMDNTGLGLKDSKDFVENLHSNPDYASTEPPALPISSPEHPYQSIRIDHSTAEVSVLYSNGTRAVIDEHHPEWQAIMQYFERGKSYVTKAAYLADQSQKFSELNTSPQSHEGRHKQPDAPPPLSHRSAGGVEDLSKKNNYVNLMIILFVLIIAISVIMKFF